MVTNSDKTRKGLSDKESLLLSRLASKNSTIIRIDDIKDELDTTYNNAKKIASKLNSKGWLERIEAGKYLIIPLDAGEKSIYTEHEFIIAANLVSEYYIGFLSALNFHGMTEQTPFSVFVATKSRKTNKTIHGIPYNFITLNKRKFFGVEPYAVASSTINISDPEKTVIDSLDHLEYSGGITEVVKGLREKKRELDIKKLIRYAIRMNNGAVVKRLHFLLEYLNYDIPDEDELKKHYTDSYSLLDNTGPNRGRYDSRWKLRINVRKEYLEENSF